MGIKELWPILAPYSETKPLFELDGEVVAIDLSGWVCDSLNVVEYVVQPRMYLKNLFYRTAFLLLANITPVFVQEGDAPSLKYAVIEKRNENTQFRGARPRPEASGNTQRKTNKGRSQFNHVLRQCEDLISCMGLQCVKGPGEAEAYCAYLNHDGLVDGVVSQDSDCFAYGATRVYRNFTVSAKEGAGGSVDIYDMKKVWEHKDLGQNKMLALALLCGCDYTPGVSGVGKEIVQRFMEAHKDGVILSRMKSWRENPSRYTNLEIKVDDKSICVNCGHHGRVQQHTKSGCSVCRTGTGCDEALWRDQRLALKAELQIRKKALVDPDFPSDAVISEFLERPPQISNTVAFKWGQPKLVRFVKFMSKLLQWEEVYSFLKVLPLLTRWQLRNPGRHTGGVVWPREIKKERCPKGVPSYEIYWFDKDKQFDGLLSDEEIQRYFQDKPAKDLDAMWSTIEPKHLTEVAYPQLVADYLEKKAQKTKKKPTAKKRQKADKNNAIAKKATKYSSLENVSDLLNVVDEIAKEVPKKKAVRRKKAAEPKGLQMIGKFMKKKPSSGDRTVELPSDLGESDEDFNVSDIVNGIVGGSRPLLDNYRGHKLIYNAKDTEDVADLSFEAGNQSFLNSTRRQSLRHDVSHFFEPIIDDGVDCFELSVCEFE